MNDILVCNHGNMHTRQISHNTVKTTNLYSDRNTLVSEDLRSYLFGKLIFESYSRLLGRRTTNLQSKKHQCLSGTKPSYKQDLKIKMYLIDIYFLWSLFVKVVSNEK